MIIYRLANTAFKDDLHGEGARMYGGRWNTKGLPVLYATEHISLAVLEVLVNKSTKELYQSSFHLLKIEIEESEVHYITISDLKKNWTDDIEYTRAIGNRFLNDPEVWILKVPSSVINEEYNFMINPYHENFKKLVIIENKLYNFNYRLIKFE